jgi:hypothetical protein
MAADITTSLTHSLAGREALALPWGRNGDDVELRGRNFVRVARPEKDALVRSEADQASRATVEDQEDPGIILCRARGQAPVEELRSDELLDLNGPRVLRVRAREARQASTIALLRNANAPTGRGHCSIATGIRIVMGAGAPRR